MTTSIQPPGEDPGREPSKYGPCWSRGFFIAAVLSLGFWIPIYLVVDDQWSNTCWYEFGIAFIVIAACLSLAWLTCTLAEKLEQRARKAPRSDGSLAAG